jgi:hypothetical protein
MLILPQGGSILDAHFQLSHVYNLLHQLGYSCLKPRPKHYKSDVKKQEEFIKALPDRLKGIAQHHPNKTLRIYFEDDGNEHLKLTHPERLKLPHSGC